MVHKSLINKENITGLLMSPCLVPTLHGEIVSSFTTRRRFYTWFQIRIHFI